MNDALDDNNKMPEPVAARRQAAMPFIMLTVLIDMIAIGLIIPAVSYTHLTLPTKRIV